MNIAYIKEYQNSQISTASRGRLLIMMYEGAIKFLGQARKKMQQKNFSEAGVFLSKSFAIISELMNTLNFEQGGQIAVNLQRLYRFMLYHLTQANLQKEPKLIEDVIALLSKLKESYSEALKSLRETKNAF